MTLSETLRADLEWPSLEGAILDGGYELKHRSGTRRKRPLFRCVCWAARVWKLPRNFIAPKRRCGRRAVGALGITSRTAPSQCKCAARVRTQIRRWPRRRLCVLGIPDDGFRRWRASARSPKRRRGKFSEVLPERSAICMQTDWRTAAFLPTRSSRVATPFSSPASVFRK